MPYESTTSYAMLDFESEIEECVRRISVDYTFNIANVRLGFAITRYFPYKLSKSLSKSRIA